MYRIFTMLTGLACLFITLPAWAEGSETGGGCQGKVLFEDQFDEDLSGWVTLPASERIEDGRFIIKTDAGKKITNLLPTFSFDKEAVCVEVEVESLVESPGAAGLIFWGENLDNLYWYIIENLENGEFENTLYRRRGGNLSVIFNEKITDLKIGPGVVNKLQADIDGTIINFMVNGKSTKKIRAQAPGTEFQVGVISQTAKAKGGKAGEHAFDNIRVTDPYN